MASPHASPQPLVADLIARLSLAPRQAAKQLTLWPLLLGRAAAAAAPPYGTLADAVAAGAARITEVDEHGVVPTIAVENRGKEAVLVLFGEELRGAKQNRIANASFLVDAGHRVAIEVSCVEAGRWGRRGAAEFSVPSQVASHSLRRLMSQKVAGALRAGRRFKADQSEVWDEVAQRVAFSRTSSATGAYADYVATRSTDLRELEQAFHPLPGQVGFAAAIGDEIVGLEVIGRPEVFARAFRALLGGYLIDAVDAAFLRGQSAGRRPAERRSPSGLGELDAPAAPLREGFDAPEPFLEALAEAQVTASPSLDLGEDLRIEGARVRGCALACREVVHLTAF